MYIFKLFSFFILFKSIYLFLFFLILLYFYKVVLHFINALGTEKKWGKGKSVIMRDSKYFSHKNTLYLYLNETRNV